MGSGPLVRWCYGCRESTKPSSLLCGPAMTMLVSLRPVISEQIDARQRGVGHQIIALAWPQAELGLP